MLDSFQGTFEGIIKADGEDISVVLLSCGSGILQYQPTKQIYSSVMDIQCTIKYFLNESRPVSLEGVDT